MNLTTMNRGWTAAVAAAILAAVALFAMASTASAASVTNVTVGSATTAPNTQVTIDVTAVGADDLGAYGIDIEYDSSLVSVVSCTSAHGVCNPEFGVATVRMNGSNLSGINGDAVLGTITFAAGGDTGVADLNATLQTLADIEGATLTTTVNDGAITIAEATPAPTAAPSDTAAPTATPGGLPATGDGWTAQTTSSMVWVLAAAGLAIAAAGAWALARANREN